VCSWNYHAEFVYVVELPCWVCVCSWNYRAQFVLVVVKIVQFFTSWVNEFSDFTLESNDAVEWLALLFHIPEVRFWNSEWRPLFSVWCSWFSSVRQFKFRDSTLTYPTTSSFQTISKSLSAVPVPFDAYKQFRNKTIVNESRSWTANNRALSNLSLKKAMESEAFESMHILRRNSGHSRFTV
jgi:hypothetical protein